MPRATPSKTAARKAAAKRQPAPRPAPPQAPNPERRTLANDQLLNTREVCKLLGVTDETLKIMRRERRIAFIPWSAGRGGYRYWRSDIDAALNALTVESEQ